MWSELLMSLSLSTWVFHILTQRSETHTTCHCNGLKLVGSCVSFTDDALMKQLSDDKHCRVLQEQIALYPPAVEFDAHHFAKRNSSHSNRSDTSWNASNQKQCAPHCSCLSCVRSQFHSNILVRKHCSGHRDECIPGDWLGFHSSEIWVRLLD